MVNARMAPVKWFGKIMLQLNKIQGTSNDQLDTDQCRGAAGHSDCLLHSASDSGLRMLSGTLCRMWAHSGTGSHPTVSLEFPICLSRKRYKDLEDPRIVGKNVSRIYAIHPGFLPTFLNKAFKYYSSPLFTLFVPLQSTIECT
ncbi:hypothetical protein Y032_0064g3517 [Ancylostoma ceylanicum]|nr:hypothetical protein Y032_0064g3517 [Ancylostoma ceylanicum]